MKASTLNKYLIISMLLVASSCQLEYKPTTRDILEANIPLAFLNVKSIYIWEGEDYKEYEVRRTPISKEVSKSLNISDSEIPYVHYLYDVEGKKTSYFIARNEVAVGVDSVAIGDYAKIDGRSIPIRGNVEGILNDLAGTFLIAFYHELIDKEENYRIERVAYVSDLIGDRWKMNYIEISENLITEDAKGREYMLDFNKNKSSLFLNLVPEEDPLIEQQRILDSIIMKMNP